jgi:hypothetical protein
MCRQEERSPVDVTFGHVTEPGSALPLELGLGLVGTIFYVGKLVSSFIWVNWYHLLSG